MLETRCSGAFGQSPRRALAHRRGHQVQPAPRQLTWLMCNVVPGIVLRATMAETTCLDYFMLHCTIVLDQAASLRSPHLAGYREELRST